MEVDKGQAAAQEEQDKLGLNEKWDDEDDDSDSDKDSGNGGNVVVRRADSDDDDSDSDGGSNSAMFALHNAAEQGDTETIDKIIQAWLNIPGFLERLRQLDAAEGDEQKERATVLRQVWQREHLDRIFQREDGENCTPLHVAVLERQLDSMKVLIARGARILPRCNNAPLTHLALSVGSIRAHQPFGIKALELMLSAEPKTAVEDRLSIDLRDDLHRTCLHLCAEFDFVSAIPVLEKANKTLLDKQWVLKDLEGYTPAHVACRVGSLDVLSAALADDCGRSSVGKRCSRGRTALHVAAEANNGRACFKILSAVPGIKDDKDDRGQTALDIAVELGCKVAIAAMRSGKEVHSVGAAKRKTLLLAHDVCSRHYTCNPKYTSRRGLFDVPPENVNRLKVLLDDKLGILKSTRFEDSLEWQQPTECQLADVLRVHDYKYVKHLKRFTDQLEENDIGELDADTAISGLTFQAALFAAGSVCDAIDRVCAGSHRNAFCAVRPPGHHAGPQGVVTSKYDPNGSHGFCFFSNAAIGAAYARNLYRHQGVKKVAIVDFDVHHGNGTEACVRNLVESSNKKAFDTPLGDVLVESISYKPWLNEHDGDNVFFASIHGFGKRMPGYDPNPMAPPTNLGMFYPADGENFGFGEYDTAPPGEPRIVDVGQNSKSRMEWRTSWRKHVLPALDDFKPDLVIISAGFDAHKLDDINMGYISALELDYYWLTKQLQRIANSHSGGKLVSVLEGGYAISGRVVSPFARSVASHVAALVESTDDEKYDPKDAEWEQVHEERMIEAAKEAQRAQERAAQLARDTDNDDAPASALDASLEPSRKRSRRATKEVDYKAENEKLNKELAEKRRLKQEQEEKAKSA